MLNKKYLLVFLFLSIFCLIGLKLTHPLLAQAPGGSAEGDLRTEISRIQADNTYIAALLFNAFGTASSRWDSFALTDGQISTLCGGPCGKIGVNAGTFYPLGGGFYPRAQADGMQYSLAIASGDTGKVISDLGVANSHGVTPTIRIGVQTDSGGFSDPQTYVNFLRSVDASVSFTVYAIAGPNEPDSESWATPGCTSIQCTGRGLAQYMNAVIAGAGNLQHVRLLSPAFNMTNAISPSLVQAMIANGANFNGVAAIAGNSYNISGIGITQWVSDFMNRSGLAGRRVFLTEIGASGIISELGQGTDPRTPQPPPYVPCPEVRPRDNNPALGSEYHSLRPYQASPCDPQIHETALYCGNDLIVRRTYSLTPDGPGQVSCSGPGDGSLHCHYIFDNADTTSNLSIDLTNTMLPIMGNTENVQNQYNNGNAIRPPIVDTNTKLNEYVSWYLNGTNQRAEEPTINPYTGGDRLINLSGPLKKLLPEKIQRDQRILEIAKGTTNTGGVIDTIRNLYPSQFNNPRPSNHNQIVGCTANGHIIQCSAQELITGRQHPIRLSDFLANPGQTLPPLEENYIENGHFNFDRFWRDYLNWLGSSSSNNCLPAGPFGAQFCPPPNNWPTLFSMIPFSSTEDRLGQSQVPNGEPVLSPDLVTQPDPHVTHVVFEPTVRDRKLYFAHMQEDSDLSDLLQKTYVSRDVPPYDAFAINDTRESYNSQRCEIRDARTNPGDNLFGNFNQPPTSPLYNQGGSDTDPVTGTISYHTEFDCDFPAPQRNRACIQNCAGDAACIAGCPNDPVPACHQSSMVALSVYTRTPQVNKIWEQLVNGNASFVKMIYPRTGANTPIDTIHDVPAVSNAAYSSSAQTIAGDPGTARDGSQAQIFFPHIGGIYDYFLHGVQQAIRPQGLGPNPISGGNNQQPPPPVSSTVNPGQCRPTIWSGVPISGFPGPIQNAFQAASAKFNIPTCVLTAIASIEGSRMRTLTDQEAQDLTRPWSGPADQEISQDLFNRMHCSANSAGAVGPMQITPDSWFPYVDASQGYLGSRVPSRCNAADAIFATAEFLVQGRLPIYGYPAGSDWTNPRKVCAAGQTNYGSCRLDAPTCNNLGTNYCDFMLNYCRSALNFPSDASCSTYFTTAPR